jgi:hypothetical protein
VTYVSSNRKPSSAACAVPAVPTTIGSARSEPSEQHFPGSSDLSMGMAVPLLGVLIRR